MCRDSGLRCSANCVCGSNSKPCKNNKEVVINQRQPLSSSAFERHQIALKKEKERVQVNFLSCAIGTRSALTYHQVLQSDDNGTFYSEGAPS